MSGVLVVAGHALRESLRRRVFAVVVVPHARLRRPLRVGRERAVQGRHRLRRQRVRPRRAHAGGRHPARPRHVRHALPRRRAGRLPHALRRSAATPRRGLLQPLIVRPLGRRQYLAGRFLAAASVAFTYVAVVYAGAVVVTGVDRRLVAAVARRRRPAPGARGRRGRGAVAAGLDLPHRDRQRDRRAHDLRRGLLAGLLGSIGDALNSHTLQTIAEHGSWALPFEALYRDALRLLVAGHPRRHRRDRPARTARRLARRRRAPAAVDRRLPGPRGRRGRVRLRPPRPYQFVPRRRPGHAETSRALASLRAPRAPGIAGAQTAATRAEGAFSASRCLGRLRHAPSRCRSRPGLPPDASAARAALSPISSSSEPSGLVSGLAPPCS